MPELPEVETVVRDLRPEVTGQRIEAVRVGALALRRPWDAGWGNALTGRRIATIQRRGKWIVVMLDSGAALVLHLGMTGQLTVGPADRPVAAHTHLIFDLGADRQLRFRDIRRFGSATLWATPTALDAFFASAGLGPEPFDLRPSYWRDRLATTARCLKAVLLDQRVVAGVGNIYADESLFRARLHPGLLGRELEPSGADRLRRAVAAVLSHAINRRGSTIRDYVGGSGLRGEFQNEFRVYGRTGAPCPRCRTPIVRTRLAGRSTHYCPQCQGGGGVGVSSLQ